MENVFIEVANLDNFKRMAIIVIALWLLMIAAVLVDLWTGVEKARVRREKIHSGGFRRTFAKVGEYWRVLAMLLLLDIIGNIFPWYNFPFASIAGTVGAIVIEFRSVVENLRAKRSSAAGIPDIIRDIVACKDPRQAACLVSKMMAGAGENVEPVKTETNETETV